MNEYLNRKYKSIIFYYIGTHFYGTIISRKRSKQVFNITGKDGKLSYLFFIGFCIASLILNIFKLVDLSSFKENPLYIFIEPMNLFDFKFFIFLFVIIIVIIKRIIIYKKIEPKGSSLNIYARELPSNLRPAHMRLLLNDGLIDETSLGSTILDLIDRGYLEYYKGIVENDKLNFFHNKDSKLIKTNKSQGDLLRYEKLIIEWFIDMYGNGVEVSSSQVNFRLTNESQNIDLEPANIFYEWQGLVLMSFPIDKYYRIVSTSKHKRIYSILGLIGLFTLFTYIGAVSLVYFFGILMLANPYRALNKVGVDEICEWLSLKKFLMDFGDMKNKTAEMIKIWNFYLTYSIALDLSKNASKEITMFFGNNIYIGNINVVRYSKKVENDNQHFIELNNLIELKNYIREYEKDKIVLFDKLKLEIEEEYKKL